MTLFRSVDIAAFAAALSERLRIAGVEVGLEGSARFARGLSACPPTDVTTLFWVARTCLVHDHRDLPTFDAVFAALFRDESLAMAAGRQHLERATVKTTGTLLRSSAPADGFEAMAGRMQTTGAPEIVDEASDEDDVDELPELHERLPSTIADLADTPFDQLSEDDLDQLGAWLEHAARALPERPSRRLVRSHQQGPIDLRRTLSLARTTAGEPIRLSHRRPRKRPRRVVMIADVSGSMESYARIYLHLMRSLVIGGDAEVFALTTSLHRVTVPLRNRDATAAIDRVNDEIPDRFGGTRIGASIGQLVRSPVWSNSVRGAVVIIASDGWDGDDPAELERHLARLQRMAHRIIWINPRTAAPDYEPLVGAIATAAPMVDTMLSGHTLNAMRELLTAL